MKVGFLRTCGTLQLAYNARDWHTGELLMHFGCSHWEICLSPNPGCQAHLQRLQTPHRSENFMDDLSILHGHEYGSFRIMPVIGTCQWTLC